MPGWDRTRKLVEYEFTQSKEEGRDPAAVEALRPALADARDDEQKLQAVWDRLLAVPMRSDWQFDEPSELAAIRARRAPGIRRAPLSYDDDELLDRLHGAWLGRCCGCALGKPIEGWMGRHDDGTPTHKRIKRYLLAISPDEYPLNNYFTWNEAAGTTAGERLWCEASWRERIAFMESDDDIRYTVLGQIILDTRGRDFTTLDVARAWVGHLPYGYVCTAETQAYRNLVARHQFHFGQTKDDADVDWHWVATHHNSYREWIGAQIRVDSYGYAAPGNPELAAEFAWRDARLSHVKNGVYGAMFCAAMIAAAFVQDEPLKVVEAGLAEIPRTSRLYRDVRQVVDLARRHRFDPRNLEPALDELHDSLGHYNAVHTNNNAGAVVLALLLGGDYLEKVITTAVMAGWDTDCNGATAGSICGAMVGARRLPMKWTSPLRDTLRSAIIDYHPIAITECARRSLAIAQRVRG